MQHHRRILDVGDERASLVGNMVELVPPPPNNTKRTPILQVGSTGVCNAEMITITLFAEPPDDFAYAGSEAVRAWIEWGAGTATHAALVDFLRGTMLSVNATFLKIVAVHEVGPDPGNRWHVAASLAYGTRPSHGNAPTTTIRPVGMPLAPGAEISTLVLPFAIASDVLVSPAGASVEVAALDRGETKIYTERQTDTVKQLPVVGGQYAFVVRNTGPDPIESVAFRQILAL